MTAKTNKNKIYASLQKLIFFMALLFLTSSCNFFEDELKQDKQLAFYRYQTYKIIDSIQSSNDRIVAYKKIIQEANEDEVLITPRKKNKLLSEIYNVMGGDFYETKNIKKGIENSTYAIVLDSTNQNAYYNRACMYQHLGQDSLAIEDYAMAIFNDSGYTDAYYNRGIIYQKRTDFQLAAEDYSRAIELNPTYLVDVYNNRGNVYQVMEFYDKAIKDYNVALRMDSSQGSIYCNRADAYARKGEFEKARQDFKQALLKDSTNEAVMHRIELLRKSIEGRRTVKTVS